MLCLHTMEILIFGLSLLSCAHALESTTDGLNATNDYVSTLGDVSGSSAFNGSDSTIEKSDSKTGAKELTTSGWNSKSEILTSTARIPIVLSSSTVGELSTSNPSTSEDQKAAFTICNMSLITSEDENAEHKRCSCDGMDVDCAHRGVTELPNHISFPKGIHIASFAGNEIENIYEDTFYNGKDVVELDLSNNRIDFVSTKAFGGFKNLKRLDLSHNRLWSLPTKSFSQLTGLRRLDLSFNDLGNVFPEVFQPLSELRELYLESNPLCELEPKHFEHLESLEKLNLESTMLKVIPDHLFLFTPKLKVLSLADNQLFEVPSEALKNLDRLKTLDLSGNSIRVIQSDAFKGMGNLVILYLDRLSLLSHIEKYAFGDLVHLQELHCSYNKMLSKIDELAFVRKVNNKKVSLSQLFLRQNELSAIPKSLLDWQDKIELHMRDNPLTCDCETAWMVNTRLKNNFQMHATCARPAEYVGFTVEQLKGHDLSCGMELSEIVMITCATITALLILFVIIAFLVWRRSYAGYSKPYYYIPRNKHIHNDYRGGDDDI